MTTALALHVEPQLMSPTLNTILCSTADNTVYYVLERVLTSLVESCNMLMLTCWTMKVELMVALDVGAGLGTSCCG